MTSHAPAEERRRRPPRRHHGPVDDSLWRRSGTSGADANTMTVSYSQVVADQLPLWIADDAGLFKAQGLDVTLTNLSSSDGFPALISGQTQLASIGGVRDGLRERRPAAQVSYLATLTPVFPYEFFAKVNDPQQLKGKRIGVTSTSGSLYVATLEALKQIGLSAQRRAAHAAGLGHERQQRARRRHHRRRDVPPAGDDPDRSGRLPLAGRPGQAEDPDLQRGYRGARPTTSNRPRRPDPTIHDRRAAGHHAREVGRGVCDQRAVEASERERSQHYTRPGSTTRRRPSPTCRPPPWRSSRRRSPSWRPPCPPSRASTSRRS